MPARGRILLYGHYPTLLQTRRWILEKAGFRVWIATQFAELENILTTRPIDLLILSHTLQPRFRKGTGCRTSASTEDESSRSDRDFFEVFR